nr:unnamed protein product [Callosobruchus analis]
MAGILTRQAKNMGKNDGKYQESRQIVATSSKDDILNVILRKVEETYQGITDLRNKFDEMQIKMEMIKNSTQINRTKIDSVYSKIDSLEQNSKRSNLRFFGLRETTDEICKNVVLDILTNKMKLNSIRVDDIEAAYRVGTAKPNTPRAVVVKFYSVKIKDDVYSKKKVLKGSKITIREDLTCTYILAKKLSKMLLDV